MSLDTTSIASANVITPDAYAALFAALTEGLAVLDLNGTIIRVNPALQSILGTPEHKLLGRTLDDICTDRERAGVRKMLKEVITEQRTTSEAMVRCEKLNQREFWIRLTLSAICSNGKPTFAIAQVEHDTRRHGLQSASSDNRRLSILARANHSFNSESSVSPSSIMRSLVNWGLQLVPSDTGTYGINTSGKIEFTEYLESGSWKPIDQPADKRQLASSEYCDPYFSNDGKDDPRASPSCEYFETQSLISIPVLDRKGELLAALQLHSKSGNAYSHDDVELLKGLSATAAIALENARLRETTRSEMDRRDNALRVSEERFYCAQEAAKIGAFDWNLENGQITWWAEVPTLRGVVPNSDASSWRPLLHKEDFERVKCKVRQAINNSEDFDFDCRLTRADGEVIWLRAVGHMLKTAENVRHYVGVAIDISSRKLTEEALMNSEKLATIGRMSATIAHEINNPIEAVLNLVYLARTSAEREDTKAYLSSAEHEIARVSQITRQTLGFYKDTTAPSQLDLSSLVEETLELYRRKLMAKHIVLQTRLQRPVLLEGLRGELKQVVANLLSNAIDASSEHSSISIRTRNRRDCVEFTVADCGSGVPPELRKQIFVPFFTTKKQIGTGLGLWVTRGIVEKHQGSIRLRSSVGANSGTAFMVRLPRNMITPAASR